MLRCCERDEQTSSRIMSDYNIDLGEWGVSSVPALMAKIVGLFSINRHWSRPKPELWWRFIRLAHRYRVWPSWAPGIEPCNLGNAKAQVGLASSCNANGHMHVGHVLTRRKKPCLGLWYKILCVCLMPVFFFSCFCFLFVCLGFFSCFALFCLFVCLFFSSLSVNF